MGGSIQGGTREIDSSQVGIILGNHLNRMHFILEKREAMCA